MTVPTRETATRFVVLGFLAAFTVGAAPATPASPWVNLAKRVFVRVDTTDLPAPDVEALAQDSLGFIWVGMQGGLARFSGYRFQSFVPDARNPKALPDANIETIVPDSSGDLWLGTGSRGLVHYDALTETFRTWRADPRGRAGPRSTTVNAIAREKDGSLWVGGDAGLDRFDPGSGTFEPREPCSAGRRAAAGHRRPRQPPGHRLGRHNERPLRRQGGASFPQGRSRHGLPAPV